MNEFYVKDNQVQAIILMDGLTNQRSTGGEVFLDKKLKKKYAKLKTCWKIYNPVSRKGEVETTEVYPYFFGLTNSFNPGRTGFEMVKKGDLLPEFSTFVTVRTAQTQKALDINKKHGVYARISDYSSDKGTVLMAATNPKKIQEALDELKESIDELRVTHYYDPGAGWYDKVKKEDSPFAIAGYLDGPLKFALQIVGLKFLHEEDRYMKYNGYKCTFKFTKKDLENRVDECMKLNKIPVFYFKLFAQEGRFNGDKRYSAKVVSKAVVLIMKALEKYSKNPSALIISDHNSEKGIDRTFAGNTKFALLTSSEEKIAQFETTIPNGAIEQAEFISYFNFFK